MCPPARTSSICPDWRVAAVAALMIGSTAMSQATTLTPITTLRPAPAMATSAAPVPVQGVTPLAPHPGLQSPSPLMLTPPRSLEEFKRRIAQLKLQGFQVRTMRTKVAISNLHPNMSPVVLAALRSKMNVAGPQTTQSANLTAGIPLNRLQEKHVLATPALADPCSDSPPLVLTVDGHPYSWAPDSMLILTPGSSHEFTGCKLDGGTTHPKLDVMMYPDTNKPGNEAGLNATNWTKDKVSFSVPSSLSSGQLDQFSLVQMWAGSNLPYIEVIALFQAQRGAPTVLSNIPANSISAMQVGSPLVAAPMSNFYGLNATMGVARLGLTNGILAGQDTISLKLTPGFVVTSADISFLNYSGSGATSVNNGTPSQAPTVQNSADGNAKIIVNWPISSIVPNGQVQPVYYSVYGLNITVQGPNGVNPGI